MGWSVDLDNGSGTRVWKMDGDARGKEQGIRYASAEGKGYKSRDGGWQGETKTGRSYPGFVIKSLVWYYESGPP